MRSNHLVYLVISFLSLFLTLEGQASRARILVMGSGDGGTALQSSDFTAPTNTTIGQALSHNGNAGSLSYDDEYNMFYNPSYITEQKNWAIIEKSNFPGAGAQGGFITTLLQYSLGLYFNRVGGLGLQQNPQRMRPIELFFAKDGNSNGDARKFGLSVGYGTHINTALDQSLAREINVRAGAQVGDFHPFVNGKPLAILGPGRSGREFGGGTRYFYGEWLIYTAGRFSNEHGGSRREYSYGAGLGRNTIISHGLKLNYSVGFWKLDTKSGGNFHHRRSMIPLELSVEANAVNWLTLRAGLGHRIMDSINGNSEPEATSGRVGGTFHLGPANLNWIIGSVGGFQESNIDADSQTFDLTSGFFTAASLGYTW